ncbi:MAG: helix-turn-helix transcriptional regulator [Planctomycetaceae bacterium]
MKKSKFTKQYARLLHALRDARQAAGLTQVEVAERFEAHAPFVSKCESGERRIDVVELAAFCRIYGITVSDLLKSAGIE